MAPRTFTATFGGERGEAPAVEIPFDVKAAYGSARPKVRVTVNGVTLRTTVAVYGGKSYIGFRKEIRDAAHLQIGTPIDVTIELDAAPRVVDVPADLQRALAKHARARRKFESLSYSHRNEHVKWVAGAKKEETRARRIARVIEMLAD
ncbi:MAG TPA: YdeI/OmpD-associated family protein [Vicinamibacterales bacterium]|jgi:hypothetical protein